MAEQILSGIVPDRLKSSNSYVNAILSNLASRKNLPEIDTFLSTDDVARGFRRWREQTSTSPSGCHLGLRRIPAIPIPDKEIEAIRGPILAIQTGIINIPLSMGFSPKRWQTVFNAMLEKIPGKPLLHKLRVIHILEADYNLTLKAIFGKRLMHNCEKFGVLLQQEEAE
jgi:hypothetical protein